MIKSSIKRIQLFVVVFIFFANSINAQVSQDNQLFKVLKAKDSLMFEIGFNQCDLNQIEQLLPEKFEFYHDKDGIITSRVDFIKSIKKNVCNSGDNRYQRVLKEGSMEVFPLYQNGELYGAIQSGVHSFETGSQFGNTIARFTNLWLKENGEWMPTRIMSYDHKMRDNSAVVNIEFIKLSSGDLSTYLGKYKFSPDFILSIIEKAGKIYGDAQGEKVEVRPIGNHKFLDEKRTIELNFVINDKGRAIGLEMTGSNGKMIAQKIN